MRNLYILLVLSIGFTCCNSEQQPVLKPNIVWIMLKEWEDVLEKFTPWVFRAPESDMEQPFYPRN